MSDELMTTQQVATYLGVPIATIYQWRTRGLGPRASRIGRHLRWRRSEVDGWVEQRAAARR